VIFLINYMHPFPQQKDQEHEQVQAVSSLLVGEYFESNRCRDGETTPVTHSQSLFNVTRDLNTTELIFEENRKYCNNKGCNMVTNESYCSPLHFEFLG